MIKRSIEFTSSSSRYNAGGKAVKDVASIAASCGYKPLEIRLDKRNYLSPIWYYNVLRGFILLFFCFLRSNVIFIQYPIYSKIFRRFISFFLKKNSKTEIIILVHDLLSMQRGIMPLSKEIAILKYANKIIVHNDSMGVFLSKEGIDENRMIKLFLFDYLTNKCNQIPRTLSGSVCYAGNLSKSLFLDSLSNHISSAITIRLYGKISRKIDTNQSIRYEGKFLPEEIDAIKGDWGLVWDGDSCSRFEGIIGNYLSLISPHKVSLYIAAELPIIIGAQSALAQYIVSHNLGIVINSIDELEYCISQVSKEQYNAILESVKTESEKLRKGEKLKSILLNN